MAVDCIGDDAQKSRRQCGAFKGFHCVSGAKQSRQTLAVFDKDQTLSTPILPKIHNNSPAWPSPSDSGSQRKGQDTALTFYTVICWLEFKCYKQLHYSTFLYIWVPIFYLNKENRIREQFGLEAALMTNIQKIYCSHPAWLRYQFSEYNN